MKNNRALAVATVVTLVCASCDRKPGMPVTPELVDSGSTLKPSADMIHIDFVGGYDQDEVVLLADGKEVFSGTLSIGPNFLSRSIRLRNAGSRLHLVITINGKGWESDIDLTRGRALQIIYLGGEVRLRQSKTVFPYT